MNGKIITIDNGKITIVLRHIPKNKRNEVQQIFRSSLKQVEDILTVPAEKVIEDLKKENPMIGTAGGSLRAYRMREGLTQTELAQKANIPQGHISAMENGKRNIGPKIAKKLAKVLNCRWEKLIS